MMKHLHCLQNILNVFFELPRGGPLSHEGIHETDAIIGHPVAEH